MSIWNLRLVFDWGSYENGPTATQNPFYGRFTVKEWSNGGAPLPDFIAADIKGNDTISFSLAETSGKEVFVNQLVVIFTKQAGAGSEACSPIMWTDLNNANAKSIPLGMVIFIPSSQPAQIPADGWSSIGCPTYPPGVVLTIPSGAGPNAYESTVCAEIWDGSTPAYKAFWTHDPDMDVTP